MGEASLLKEIEGWHEFYLPIGSAGAALTGLLFILVSLGPRVAKRVGRGGMDHEAAAGLKHN